jgi:hypothetical protein
MMPTTEAATPPCPKSKPVTIDVDQVVGAVIHEVSSREHEGKLARVVVATRIGRSLVLGRSESAGTWH